MKWTCDKCGKEMEFSQEQLAETGGAVVCPQCLTSAVVPGFSSRKVDRHTPHTTPSAPIPPIPPKEMANNSTTTPARRQTISFVESPTRPTPPPHQGRGKTTPPAHNTEPPTRPQPKKKSSNKKSKTGLMNPPSTLGCLLRTVWYTAILLAVYLLMGLVLGM